MTAAPLVAPFPYFGGKRRAAPLIWAALGDPAGYVEPFAGSAAVLLARPPFTGRRVETINDLDGWLVNMWRAIQLDPAGVARHAAGPVTEIDYHARLAWLQERRNDGLVSWLEGDPEACDAKAAGYWLYVMACGIGDPFDAGPWRVIDGRLTKTGTSPGGINRGLPHLGDAGQGIRRETDLDHYLTRLSHRLRNARITCGPWHRVTTPSVTRAGTGGDGARAVLLDPPYTTSGDLYHASRDDTGDISTAAREWALTADPDLRIVLCGYEDEHDQLLAHGWQKRHGRSGSGGGYRNDLGGRRERLWISPSCHGVTHHQHGLFEDTTL